MWFHDGVQCGTGGAGGTYTSELMYKVITAVALAVVGGITYWFWSQGREVRAPAPPPPPPRVAAPVIPDASPEATIQHPIERAQRAGRPLPELDESDGVIRDGMAGLFGARRLAEFFLLEGIIRRVVATVDNLSREQVAPDAWPLRPVPGAFLVEETSGLTIISPKNAARYESRLRLAESVNVKKLADLYVRHYPLFQRAYKELGYPKGYFNDRLIDVIDHLLDTPDLPEQIRLARPGVRYEYVDPDLQSRSAGQKILLRMGPPQAARLKTVLRAFRREITR